MTKFNAFLTASAALIAAPALAQETAPAPAAPAQSAPAQTAPAAPATPAPAAAGSVTDAEVATFAKAAIAVDKVTKDTTLAQADKNKKLAEVVTAAGIQPDRFNAIATASGTDSALQQRIQTAIVAEQQSGAAPTK